MDINYPKGFVRSALSISISVALVGCAATPTDIRQSRGTNQTLSSAQWQSNLDRARAEFSRGNYGNAIVLLEAEIANRPASVAALNGLGACYDQLGRFDVAQRYYYRALDMAPESSTTLSNIGYSYMQEGRHEEAIQILELALQRDTGNITAASNLAMAKSKFSESGLESTLASEQTQNPGASGRADISAGNPSSTASTTQSVPGASLVQILDSIAGSQQTLNDSSDFKVSSSDIKEQSNPDQVVEEPFKKIVEQSKDVELSAIPNLPSPASLTSAVSETNTANKSSLIPSTSVIQPETKVAAINPVPVPANSLRAIASAQTDASLTGLLPAAPVIREPSAVIIEPESLVEKSAISALEMPEPLTSAMADSRKTSAVAASQSTAVPQPENGISAIDPLPTPTLSQQSIEPTPQLNK